ncbi:MAG: 1-phosphofructokinase family hexose kinase [Xanthobacteraceae bacterium]
MADVVTLTMNPAIDLSVSVERVTPFHKLRSSESRRDPGGGGINVARVMKRLGADVTAVYPAGGALGQLLRRLVDLEGISAITIPIAAETREDFTVTERATGFQYRFVLPGPQLSEHEWRACLAQFAALETRTRFVVCSGSLPPGVPDDFYGSVVQAAKAARRKIIVDSSGPPLRAALEAGIYLVKPSLNELKILLGVPLDAQAARIEACRALIEKKRAEVVALTLGEQGALLVTRDRVLRAGALPIKPVSVVGAGDSFLGAMIWALASGHAMDVAFRYGVAAGSAALLVPGTELSQREDIERLVKDVALDVLSSW